MNMERIDRIEERVFLIHNFLSEVNDRLPHLSIG